MKTNSHLWWRLAEFFLEWEICQIKVVEKKPTFYVFFFLENHAFYDVEKYFRGRQVTI